MNCHRNIVILISVVASFLATDRIYSQSFPIESSEPRGELTPWEPDDLVENIAGHLAPSSSIFAIGSLWLIGNYQRHISTKSISRCPFSLSCSNFATAAIREYGLVVGLCLFIDRHFYRENNAARYHYQLIETSDGVLKIDDTYFLKRGRR